MGEKHITNRRDRESAKYRKIHADLARDVALAKVKSKREIHQADSAAFRASQE